MFSISLFSKHREFLPASYLPSLADPWTKTGTTIAPFVGRPTAPLVNLSASHRTPATGADLQVHPHQCQPEGCISFSYAEPCAKGTVRSVDGVMFSSMCGAESHKARMARLERLSMLQTWQSAGSCCLIPGRETQTRHCVGRRTRGAIAFQLLRTDRKVTIVQGQPAEPARCCTECIRLRDLRALAMQIWIFFGLCFFF